MPLGGCQGTVFCKNLEFHHYTLQHRREMALQRWPVRKFRVTKFTRHELARKSPLQFEIWSVSSTFSENTGLCVVAKF